MQKHQTRANKCKQWKGGWRNVDFRIRLYVPPPPPSCVNNTGWGGKFCNTSGPFSSGETINVLKLAKFKPLYLHA